MFRRYSGANSIGFGASLGACILMPAHREFGWARPSGHIVKNENGLEKIKRSGFPAKTCAYRARAEFMQYAQVKPKNGYIYKLLMGLMKRLLIFIGGEVKKFQSPLFYAG